MVEKKVLNEFIAFIEQHHLDDFVTEELNILSTLDIPIVKLLRQAMPEEVLREEMKDSAQKLFQALRQGIESDRIKETLWETEELSKVNIHPSDLVSVYGAQKKAMLKFLSAFTNDVKVAVKITEELATSWLLKEELKILLLEDSSADAELLQNQLVRHGLSFTCSVVDTRADFIESLKTFAPHLILSDHSLPQFNSVEAMEIARKTIPGVPFIIVTGSVSDEFAADIIKQGADDYILKDKLARLPSAIESARKHCAIKKERKQIFEELIKSEQQLKKKVEDLNRFIYQLSHNIRGPISTVKGLLYVADNDKNTIEELDTYLLMIGRSIDKLDHTLISLIRAVEIIERPLQITKVDLHKCIEEVREQLKTVSGYESIHFNIDIKHQEPFYSDQEKVCKVLKNIIENSITYRNRDSSQSYVSILAENSGNGIKLTIEDNGIGIPEYWQSRVFDMFTRASTSSTGSGLGLYIAKSIMEKLSGSILLESKPQKGTTISIYQ